MHCKLIVRNLLVAFIVFALIVTGITVLVLAASGDSEATKSGTAAITEQTALLQQPEPAQSAPASAVENTLSLTPQEDTAAAVHFLYSDEVIPYQTIYVEDPTLEKGVEEVETEGETGLRRSTTELVLHNGAEVSRQEVGTVVLREPVDRVIRVGTYVPPAKSQPAQSQSSAAASSASTTTAANTPSGSSRNFLSSVTIDEVNKTITTPSGEVFSYSSVMTGEATAYSCEGNPNATTATGTKARVGAVAVDPSVIPLGTRMFIMLSDGSLIYGYCVAEDTGGAVKGNIIDLYMNTIADCSLVGRSACTVYFLT